MSSGTGISPVRSCPLDSITPTMQAKPSWPSPGGGSASSATWPGSATERPCLSTSMRWLVAGVNAIWALCQSYGPALSTFCRVPSRTISGAFITRETVAILTPALLATSYTVDRPSLNFLDLFQIGMKFIS